MFKIIIVSFLCVLYVLLNLPDGWLAKYCIFNKGTLEIYKKTFDAVSNKYFRKIVSFPSKLRILRRVNSFVKNEINVLCWIVWLFNLMESLKSLVFLVCVQVDDRGLGWLSAEDTMIALRVINRSLTDAEEHYMTRVCVFLC